MITFFNMQNNNKAVKEAQKVILPKIAVNQKLFVPMIAKTFDMEESNLYDDLTDEKLDYFLQNPQNIDLTKNHRAYAYHANKNIFEPTKEVMIRLLCPFRLNIDFSKNTAKPSP